MRINEFTPDVKIFKSIEGKLENKQKPLDFQNLIKEKLNLLNKKQIISEQITENFIKGNEKNVHNVMIAASEAKMSLDMAIEVRNKVVEAYQELNRIQI